MFASAKRQPTLSSKFLIRSAVRLSTTFPRSFKKFSYSCAFSESLSTCLELTITYEHHIESATTTIPNNLPFRPLLPPNRILTSHPELTTLATNRGIATAFCFALPARFASAGDSTIIARGNARPLTGDGDFRKTLDTSTCCIGIVFRRGHSRCTVRDRDRLRWCRIVLARLQRRHRLLRGESFAWRILGRIFHRHVLGEMSISCWM